MRNEEELCNLWNVEIDLHEVIERFKTHKHFQDRKELNGRRKAEK